jgi:glucosamine--fructose-6-phosphate aminotransferase (isomerizing)
LSHAYDETMNQPNAWSRALQTVPDQWDHVASTAGIAAGTPLLFVGSGTSLYIARVAARSAQELTGHTARAVPASEVFLSPESSIVRDSPPLAFVISRSGATSEALLAADFLREQVPGAIVVGVTCNGETELARRSHYVIELPDAAERAIVMTQSFTTMVLALQVIAARIAGNTAALAELDRLPELGRQLMRGAEEFGRTLATDSRLDTFVYLGLGPNYGLAEEATLKLKEMTQTPCESHNPLEFRHGPISIVRPGTATVVLEGLRERRYIEEVKADVQKLGAYVAVISPTEGTSGDLVLRLPDGLSDVSRCVLYMPPLQLTAYHRACALGLDPDRPRNLDAVVVL